MAKYSYELKLKIVQFYLSGNAGYTATAAHFNVTRSHVGIWVAYYQRHGVKGLKPCKQGRKYPLDLRLKVVTAILEQGLSLRGAAVEFNVSGISLVSQWLCLYQKGGVEALKPKIRGRKPMKTPLINQTDEQKTHTELLKELAYLRAEIAYLKKLEALAKEEAQQKKQKSFPS